MNKYNFYLTIIFMFFLKINNSFNKLTNDIPNNYEFLNELFRFNKIDLFKQNNKSLLELKEFIKNLKNNSYREIQQ